MSTNVYFDDRSRKSSCSSTNTIRLIFNTSPQSLFPDLRTEKRSSIKESRVWGWMMSSFSWSVSKSYKNPSKEYQCYKVRCCIEKLTCLGGVFDFHEQNEGTSKRRAKITFLICASIHPTFLIAHTLCLPYHMYLMRLPPMKLRIIEHPDLFSAKMSIMPNSERILVICCGWWPTIKLAANPCSRWKCSQINITTTLTFAHNKTKF